ncbi:MAG: MFS transporter [Alphaproteobacteria bacterium]
MTVDSSRTRAWIVWFLASSFYAYQYVLRVLPNIMMPDIMQKFSMDAKVFGQMSGLYYLGYALMHIPIGLLLDRVGPRMIMAASAVLTICGVLPLLYTDIWYYPLIGRFMVGMGSSGAILGVFKVIRMGFPEERFTSMLGLSVTIGLIGAIYGGQPVNYLMATFGWEQVLTIICLAGLIMAAGMLILIPSIQPSASADSNVWQDIKSVLGNRSVVIICLCAGLMVGPLEGFADVWGTEFLKAYYGYSDAISATIPSMIFFGMCFGATILSWIADKTQAHFRVIIGAGLVMTVGFVLLLSGLMSQWMMTSGMVIIGIACAYQIPAIYKASTYVKEEVVSLTVACANMIIMIFGYVFHGSIGAVMSSLWQGTMRNGYPVYAGETFVAALSLIPIGLMLGTIGFLVVRRR